MKKYKIINTIMAIITILSLTGFIVLWIDGGYTEKVSNKLKAFSKKDEYSYLCIGNSITRHGKCEYWFGEWGMAASNLENDYVHVLDTLLGDNSSGKAINFSTWETLAHDRAQTLSLLDTYLNTSLDLVTIQLGENVVEKTTIESDFIDLIEYVKEKSPNSKIIIIGQFWANDIIENAKINASNKCDVTFISLAEIQTPEYQWTLGAEIYGDDGLTHTINHNGVAKHPNDLAMKYIANKIYNELK